MKMKNQKTTANSKTQQGLKFKQIFQDIRDDIVSEDITVGSHLLGVRDLMKHYSASYKTISLALKELDAHGLIKRRQGQGIFVQEKHMWKLDEIQSKKESKGLIGLIVPDMKRQYFVRLVNALEKNVTHKGYNLLIRNSNYDSQIESKIVEQFIEENVKGIILVPTYDEENSAYYARIDKNIIPLLFLNRKKLNYHCSYIIPNNSDGVYKAVQHLIEKGHRDIAYISIGRTEAYDPIFKVFKNCLKVHELNIQEDLIQYADSFSPESGYQSMMKILNATNKPTALFCCYTDNLIIGALRACKEEKLSIPDDISVVGCGNDDITQFLETQITIIRNPIEMMGHLAINGIDDLIENRIPVENCIELKVEMDFREKASVKNLL